MNRIEKIQWHFLSEVAGYVETDIDDSFDAVAMAILPWLLAVGLLAGAWTVATAHPVGIVLAIVLASFSAVMAILGIVTAAGGVVFMTQETELPTDAPRPNK